MSNSIKFTPSAKATKADRDSVVRLQNLPSDNPAIRIEGGSSGHIKINGKATAFSFDIDARNSVGRAFKLPKGATWFSVCGGPLIFTPGSGEWVS